MVSSFRSSDVSWDSLWCKSVPFAGIGGKFCVFVVLVFRIRWDESRESQQLQRLIVWPYWSDLQVLISDPLCPTQPIHQLETLASYRSFLRIHAHWNINQMLLYLSVSEQSTGAYNQLNSHHNTDMFRSSVFSSFFFSESITESKQGPELSIEWT